MTLPSSPHALLLTHHVCCPRKESRHTPGVPKEDRLVLAVDALAHHVEQAGQRVVEGQRLIQDLALLHAIQRDGFAYFRDVVLSIEPMIALLKHGEQLGFYIDSANPFFRLKIEPAHHADDFSRLDRRGLGALLGR